MKRIGFALIVGIAALFYGCKEEEERLKAELTDAQSKLDQAEDENKILAFKNIILTKKSDNVLVKEVKSEGITFRITFEDEEVLETDTAVMVGSTIDSLAWSVTFELNDETTVDGDFLTGKLKLDATNLSVDPFKTAPLSALLKFLTAVDCKVNIKVKGQDGAISDVAHADPQFTDSHEVEIYGLYQDHLNEVTVNITSADGKLRASAMVTVQTAAIPVNERPTIEIVKKANNFANGYIFFDLRPFNNPMVIDQFGKIRWYLRSSLVGMYGLQRLANGNIAFGTASNNEVREYTMMGQPVNSWTVLPTYKNIHHDVIELPNGNFIVTVDKVGASTIEDKVLELDRKTGAIKTVWNLDEILPKRTEFISDPVDWFHTNAVYYDSRDNTLVLSGQRMGIVKVTWDNKLKWILSQPEGWTAEFDPYVLKSSDPNMEWIWGQHAPLIMPNGNLLLFDNGYGRHYANTEKYSRAAEFKITEASGGGGTVEAVWEYGKDRGLDMWSPIISDVDYLESGNRLLTSGCIACNFDYFSNTSSSIGFTTEPLKATIIEVDVQKNVLFEINIISSATNGSVYRAEKVNSIYP